MAVIVCQVSQLRLTFVASRLKFISFYQTVIITVKQFLKVVGQRFADTGTVTDAAYSAPVFYNSSGKYQIQSGKRAVLSKAELL